MCFPDLQHSVYSAIDRFADSKYADLRAALLGHDEEETKRFYQFLIASVLATDIADSNISDARDQRWSEAYASERAAKQSPPVLSIDGFYLKELNRVDIHCRVLCLVVSLVWLFLVAISYWSTPEDNLVVLTGIDQQAAAVSFAILASSMVWYLLPHFIKEYKTGFEETSGVIWAVIVIEGIAMITNALMAFGFKTPVRIDPILGNRVHLLRWCEWAPLTFFLYFVTDGVDVPDRELGIKSKYFFALCQGVSTFMGFCFPFAPNFLVWLLLLCTAVGLFVTVFVHVSYKRKVFSKMERGVSLDETEIYDRSYHALRFLENIAITWSVLVAVFLMEGLGPFISPRFNFTRREGFHMCWTCVLDCLSKCGYSKFLFSKNLRHISAWI